MCLSTPSSPISLWSTSSPKPLTPPISTLTGEEEKWQVWSLFICLAYSSRNLICLVCPLFTLNTNATFVGGSGGVTGVKIGETEIVSSCLGLSAHSLTELKEEGGGGRGPEQLQLTRTGEKLRLLLALRPQKPNENNFCRETNENCIVSGDRMETLVKLCCKNIAVQCQGARRVTQADYPAVTCVLWQWQLQMQNRENKCQSSSKAFNYITTHLSSIQGASLSSLSSS